MTHITNTPSIGIKVRDFMSSLQIEKLNLSANTENKSILIKKNPHLHPFSWFVTSDNGQLKLSGRILPSDIEIKLSGLKTGKYKFRTQGEVYEFNLA